MDNSLKIGVYNKLLKALKQNPNVSDLVKTIPDANDSMQKYEFTCKLCQEIKMEFSLFMAGDFVKLNGRTPAITNMDGMAINEVASEITEGTSIIFTVYDSAISFQQAIPLIAVDGVEGQKRVFNDTLDFVHILCRNKDRLGCNNAIGSESVDFTNEGEDDPYGFNNYDDSEYDENAEPVLEESSMDVTADEDEFEPELELEAEDEDLEDDLSSLFSDNETAPMDNGVDEEDEMSDFEANANSPLKEEIKTDVSKQPEKKVSSDTNISDMLKKLEERKARRRAEREAHKPLEEDVFENESSPVVNPEPVLERKPIVSAIRKEDSSVGELEPVEVASPVNYERAPEVVEQMKHLYAEVDQIFAQRKKQADYREKTLDEFSDKLDRREKELNIRGSRLEQSYKEKQADLEKQTIDIETQRREIGFQWQKLDMEKSMIETQRKDLDESRALLAKSKALDAEKGDVDARVSVLNTELKEKEMEISVLKDNLDTMVKDHNDKVVELEKVIEQLQAEIQDSSESDTLKARIAELEKEIDNLNGDIDDLNKGLEDLMEDLDTKEKTIKSLKTKGGESDGRIAEWKKKEAAWAKKEAEYKKALELAKDSDETDTLQAALDAANAKVKQLESEVAKKPIVSKSDSKRVADLEKEVSRMTEELKKANADLEKEREEKETISSRTVVRDVQKEANDIKNSLAEIGVNVEPVATNGELILGGYSDVMQVIVNVDAGILYVEKPVKRGIKYRSNFEKWNMEDIRISYLSSENKIICKCVYDDISKAALDIIGKFSSLS